MGLDGWAAFADRHRRAMILFALVSTFAGVGLLIDRPKGTLLEWLAVPLLAVGGAVFAWAVWPRTAAGLDTRTSLASRFLRRVTFDGRLVRLFPAIGVGILLADLAYNFTLSATPALQTEDTIVLLAAATLVGYGFVPARFARERDFVLVFFLCLNAILVVPLLAARAYYADFERSVDLYSWVALAPETSAILNLLGVANTLHPVPGSTAPGLTFQPQNLAFQVTVVITTACSGIYSFGIFASAFVAFVATEYERLTRRVWGLLGLGLLTAYVANVLRMVVIVLIGYYTETATTDLQNMLIAHSYAGWIIFLGWVALFWGILVQFLPREKAPEAPGPSVRHETRCAACGDVLTPAVPATRCACGAYYHVVCVEAEGHCVRCQKPIRIPPSSTSHGT